MHVLYVIKSEVDDGLYIGVTNDLKRRLEEHNQGMNRSTKSRKPFKLIYCEGYKSKRDALIREKKLKQYKNSYTELKKRIIHSLDCGA